MNSTGRACLHPTLDDFSIFVAAFVAAFLELSRISTKVSTKAATKVVKVTQSPVQYGRACPFGPFFPFAARPPEFGWPTGIPPAIVLCGNNLR